MNKVPVKIKLYLILSLILDPFYFIYQKIAILRNKEERNRAVERWVNKKVKRPEGHLIWLHVASVGEALSAFPLIDKILAEVPELNVLVTSTTKTSAKLIKEYNDTRVIHQMSPYDTFVVSKRFLGHWRPDLACRVESEIWPRILFEITKRDIPNYLFNARFSKKTMERMKNNLTPSKYLLSLFDQIHVPEKQTEKFLMGLGLNPNSVMVTGALKDSRGGLPVDSSLVKEFNQVIDKRNVWLAASTHRGEDEIVLQAHKKLGGILIIVPRHIERAAEICKEIFSMVDVLSSSVLISFQGSVSAKYLFPILARFIISFNPSLSLKLSIALPILFADILIDSSASLSYCERFVLSGTNPSQYLLVSTITLLIKFPKTATSSLLFLA